jgi:hypothetical protein
MPVGRGARRTAEGLALSKAGVVAFSTTSDAKTGPYDDLPTSSFGHLLNFEMMP